MSDQFEQKVEVLAQKDESTEKVSSNKTSRISEPSARFRLHPVSGLLVILMDTLFFGGTVASGGWALPLMCFLAFSVTSFGVFLSQKFLSKDRIGASFAKGFLAGILAGVPTPISGTVFGSFVLLSAGLRPFRNRKLKP